MAISRERPKKQYINPFDAYLDYYRIINNILNGGIDSVGSVTLTTSTTDTTVSSVSITNDSFIGLTPTTLNAAGALSTTYVSSRVAGSYFILTHSNTATADRTFVYSILG